MMVLEKKKTREELKQTYKDLKRSGASVETNDNNIMEVYVCTYDSYIHFLLIIISIIQLEF